MKIVAHLQISIGEDGRLSIASLGYTLAERGSHKPVDNAEVQSLVAAFEAAHGGSHVEEPQQPCEVELNGEVRPRTAPHIVPGQAPSQPSPATAERIVSSLVALGVEAEAAAAGVASKGPQRVAEICGWMTRKQKAEGLHAPTRLFEAMIAR